MGARSFSDYYLVHVELMVQLGDDQPEEGPLQITIRWGFF